MLVILIGLPGPHVPGAVDLAADRDRRGRRCFELLKRAYVEARYSEHYEITEEQLAWLGARTEILQQHVETICQDRIATLAAPA